MKKNEKLPLTFEYLEKFSRKELVESIFFLKSSRIQTEYNVKRNPQKNFVKLI